MLVHPKTWPQIVVKNEDSPSWHWGDSETGWPQVCGGKCQNVLRNEVTQKLRLLRRPVTPKWPRIWDSTISAACGLTLMTLRWLRNWVTSSVWRKMPKRPKEWSDAATETPLLSSCQLKEYICTTDELSVCMYVCLFVLCGPGCFWWAPQALHELQCGHNTSTLQVYSNPMQVHFKNIQTQCKYTCTLQVYSNSIQVHSKYTSTLQVYSNPVQVHSKYTWSHH